MKKNSHKSYYVLNTTYFIIICVGILSAFLISSINKAIFLIPCTITGVLLINNYLNEINKINCEHLELNKKIKNVEYFNNRILEKSPNGVVVINNEGIIEYVNSSAYEILGSRSTLGLNILNFDTIINSRLYNSIIEALNGISSNIKHEIYTSYITRETKILNLSIFPDKSRDFGNVEKVVILLVDVTEEFVLKEKVEKTYLDTIEALASLVDARDPYTGQHSKNVSKYTAMICSKLDIPQQEKERIILSASFHDIGKVGIGDNVLNKAGKLTDDEYEIMKKHPSIGADIIGKIEGFEDVSNMIRYHHERWDGKGYPSKLKENEIPFGSLIIAIADTYDAITSDRVYRKGLDKNRAIQILNEEKGKQFNSDLVDIFLSVI